MKKFTAFSLASFAALCILVFGYSEDVAAKGGSELEVTVTNLTKGQVFSPFLVVTHSKKQAPLFELGSAASDELAALAEDGMTGPLKGLYMASKHVNDVQMAGGPIPPGMSASVTISTQGSKQYITLAGMAVTTNDAFFALNGVRAPKSGWKSYTSPAYDAGSEANNEMCAYIPGPPCFNPGERDLVDAEGYVYIHPGIQGVGDLLTGERDWRNPVAKIAIKRVSR